MNEKFPNPSSSTESTQASPEKLSSVISANISSKAEAQELLTADFNKRYEEDEASKRMREDEGYKETEEDVRIENENFVKTKEIESLVLELADKAKVSCEIQLPEEIQPNEAGTATMLPVKVSWNMDGGAEEKNLDIEVLGLRPYSS